MRILIVLLMVTLIGTSTLIPVGTLAAEPTDTGKGFDVSNMDKTCKPCADFYQYSNGGWMARTPIPAAYSRWGSFNEL
ncbi:MAG TPA: M13 family peptidase, partial [Acidobacteriota bacterium]|nr:M13 family peptidase [Acidobacteriota bacterium]